MGLLASATNDERGTTRRSGTSARWVLVASGIAMLGACNLLASCAESPGLAQTPMAWSADVNTEPPAVTASLVPEPVSTPPAQTMLPKAGPSGRSLPQSVVAEQETQGLRKGGGYRKIGKRYQVAGTWYTPRHDENYEETGVASWYGNRFHAKKTANGEIYDMHGLTAAHRTLPLPSLVRVTHVESGRSLVVRVNDRGPFRKGRIIDVSARVARELGFADKGTAKVHVKYVGPAPLEGGAGEAKHASGTAKR